MSTIDAKILKSRLTKHAKERDLSEQQRKLVEAYRMGKMNEQDFQSQLSKDPVLAKWVRQVLEAASKDPLSK
ncbi:hypothetical protein [Rhizobium sp. LjRoot258]|jgi:hypothetical protein|uniref:hypothetical protein n=1 Tax=Rhizobium sp. LjRoot258 TaxID=3342299 RepID=UPI003ECDB40C